MGEMCCRRRLPSPELAGCLTWEALKEKAARYPHLRPCPRILGSRRTWQWIYRKGCDRCPDALNKHPKPCDYGELLC